MIFYKIYQYSAKATLLSVSSSILSLVFAVLAIMSFSNENNIVIKFTGTVFFALAAVFSFVYFSRKLPDKIAEEDFNKKIKTDIKFAYRFCKQNPQYFESVAADFPEFSEKYYIDENKKILEK